MAKATSTKVSSVKITYPTTDERGLSNTRDWQNFVSKDSFEVFPGKDTWTERVCFSLLQWAEDPENVEIMKFLMKYRIPHTTMMEWLVKYPNIKEAYDYAKLMIGANRREGTIKRKLDGYYAYRDMHIYDPAYHAVNKYHSELKQDEAQKEHTFVINLEKPKVVSVEELKKETDAI